MRIPAMPVSPAYDLNRYTFFTVIEKEYRSTRITTRHR